MDERVQEYVRDDPSEFWLMKLMQTEAPFTEMEENTGGGTTLTRGNEG